MGARLGWNNLLTASGVVITSSSEGTGYVDDSLASYLRWKKWRSATSTADQWVKFDLGSNQSLQVLAAISALKHVGGTLKLQANATDVWTSPTVDVTVTVPTTDLTRVWATWLSAAQSLRWVRFYFTNTAAVNSYVDLGAVFAGTYLEPARSVSPALNVDRVDPSVQRFSIGGQRSPVRRAMFHKVDGFFVLQTAAARNNLRAAFDSTGASIPVLLALDPLDPSLIFYGVLSGGIGAAHQEADLWNMPIEFVEDVS
jgi:hypothetical protein